MRKRFTSIIVATFKKRRLTIHLN